MQTLVVRYRFSHLTAMIVVGFTGATAAELLHRGHSFIVRSWGDPLFWGLMLAAMSSGALIIWAIPAARMSKDSLRGTWYPFSIRWSDVTRTKVTSFFGMTGIKVYGAKSRFGLGFPIPADQIQAIYSFLKATKGAELVVAAFADPRLNKALQGDGPRPAGSARA